MPQLSAIVNGRVFNSATGALEDRSTVVIEGERIVEVTQEPRSIAQAHVIDAGGRVVLPGLIDAHVHVTAVSHDVLRLARNRRP